MSVPHSPAELERIYQRRFTGLQEYRDQVWKRLCGFLGQWIPSHAAVLDLGCGHCDFINNVHAETRYGMDLNPASSRLAAPTVEILTQNCAEYWRLKDASLDIVFTSNFFEHLFTKQDLRATLAQAHRCLKPGGRLIALGPNIRYLDGKYWDFYDHYLPLTERSLAEVLIEVGFTNEQLIPRFLPYTMAYGGKKPLWLLSLYLRLAFAWPLFGKQFLVVSRKQ